MAKSIPEQLVSKGFYIFPCEVNGKKPLVKWRDQSTRDPNTVDLWSKEWPKCNWGIDCGKSGLAVIDIDVKGDETTGNGFDTLGELSVNKGLNLPDTLGFRTPTGGIHLVYKGTIKTGAGDIGHGIDTRGPGGYIVAPGSKIDGKAYKVDKVLPMAEIPQWAVEMASPRTADVKTTVSNIELDLERNVQDAVHYLENRAAPALEGQGGDAHTFKVICHIRDYGISEQTCLGLLAEHWNERCEPPWDMDSMVLKIRNAYQYAQNSPGVNTPQAVFDTPIESHFKPSVKSDVELLPMMDLTEALSPAPPQEWLIEGWIPHREMCLFTGKEGTGKSLLALQLAMSAAYGLPWLGKPVEREYNVLYISCEDDKDEIKRRCNSIARLPEYAFLSGAVDPKRFRAVPLVGEDNAMVYEDNWKLEAGPIYLRLNATLNSLGWREPLLIFDTLSDMFMANENNRALVQHFVKRYLGRFRRDYNATIITLAHPPKSDAEYSGSTAWPAAHRSCIGVKANPSDSLPDHRVIELWKGNRTGLKGKQMHVEWRAGAFHKVNTFEIPELEIACASVDLERVFDHQEEYRLRTGQPISIVSQSPNFIGKDHHKIRDADGVLMTVKRKVDLLNALLYEGRLKHGTIDRIKGLVPVEEK